MLALSSVAWLCVAGCGDDDGAASGDKGQGDGDAGMGGLGDVEMSDETCAPGLADLPNNGVLYPDSYCGEEGCVEGGCDPFGRCKPVCNAWRLLGNVSFQAASVQETGTVGLPPKPTKSDDDICPNYMSEPDGSDVHCCQRADNSTAQTPALKLTGLKMTRPVSFAADTVSATNKIAIESDRYNWMFTLDSGKDGPVVARTGNAIPLTNGAFRPVKGQFTLNGFTHNADGLWDAQEGVPGTLETQGDQRILKLGPTSPTKDLVMVLWIDDQYDFPQMQLHMTGLEWSVPLTSDLNCAGMRSAAGFELVSELKGFFPLEAARNTLLYLSRDASANLCQLMSQAKDCSVDVAKWRN
jgi:hypothetical protein